MSTLKEHRHRYTLVHINSLPEEEASQLAFTWWVSFLVVPT